MSALGLVLFKFLTLFWQKGFETDEVQLFYGRDSRSSMVIWLQRDVACHQRMLCFATRPYTDWRKGPHWGFWNKPLDLTWLLWITAWRLWMADDSDEEIAALVALLSQRWSHCYCNVSHYYCSRWSHYYRSVGRIIIAPFRIIIATLVALLLQRWLH